MKKKLLLFAAILGSATTLFGQNTYDKVLHQQNYEGFQANGTFRNAQGELIISGNLDYGYSHVSKIDSAGNYIWSKSFSIGDQNNLTDHFIQKDEIIQLQDGNYLLTRNMMDWGTGKQITYLIKFAEDGTLIWSKRTHKNNESNVGSSLTTEMNSGKLLHVLSPTGNGKLDVLRMNTNGAIESQISLDLNISSELMGLAHDSNSAYIIFRTLSTLETFIIHVDSTGSFISLKKINDLSAQDAIVKNNSLFVVGSNSSFESIVAKVNLSNDSITHYKIPFGTFGRIKSIENQLILITSDISYGEISWFDPISISIRNYNFYASPNNLYKVDNNRFLAITNGPTIGIKMSTDDQVGLNLWDTTMTSSSFCFNGPNLYDNLISYTGILDSVSLSPVSAPFVTADSISLSWLADSLITEIGCVDHLGSLDEFDLDAQITLSPNPSNEKVVIESIEFMEAKLSVYNYQGQIQQTTFIQGTRQTLSTSHLESGLYFIRITLPTGISTTKKLVVKH